MEQLTQKILDTGKLSKNELEEKVQSKLASLGGLISEEGALHIIANELGLGGSTSTPSSTVKINEVTAGMRNVSVDAKVLRKYELRTFGPEGTGKVASVFIGDETGSLRLTFWNDKTTYFEKISEGDTLEVQQAYSRENNGRIELHMGNASHCIINPEGKVIEVQERVQTDTPDKKLQEITEQDTFVNIRATIVQAYDPRFFASDPETNKKVPEDQITGKENFNYVMNIFLDDGTSNVRAAIWKEQVQQLLGMSDQEVLALREQPDKLEEVKTDLLGKIISARARVKKNEAYNNIELVLYQINTSSQTEKTESPSVESKPETSAAPVATPVEASSEPEVVVEEESQAQAEELPASTNQVTEELLADDDEELLSIDDLEDQL